MFNILISFLICFVTSKNLIIIGDSRIQEMAQVLLNIQHKESYYFNYEYVVTKDPVSYEGYYIDVVAVTKHTLRFLFEKYEPYNSVHDKLKNAKEGTSVLLSIGFENLNDYNNIFVFYGKLADKYPKLNFYIISQIGVPGNDSQDTNTKIRKFNEKVKERIAIVGFKNMYYKNILYDNDPTKIDNNGFVINILDYSTDSEGFFKNGYNIIFKAMVEGL
jgi:hypothetical protein